MCRRFKLQSIVSHENSAAHRDSVKLELVATVTPDITEAVHLSEVPSRGMERAFSCLYFLAKQKIPHTTNFEPLLDFLELLGLDVKDDICVAKNATYTSDKSIQEMLFIMSEVIETQILAKMKDSDHFALMLDETTDCSITEQLAVHECYVHPQRHKRTKVTLS